GWHLVEPRLAQGSQRRGPEGGYPGARARDAPAGRRDPRAAGALGKREEAVGGRSRTAHAARGTAREPAEGRERPARGIFRNEGGARRHALPPGPGERAPRGDCRGNGYDREGAAGGRGAGPRVAPSERPGHGDPEGARGPA